MAPLALRRGFKSFRLPSVRLVTVRRTCEATKRFWWGRGGTGQKLSRQAAGIASHVCLLTVHPHDQVSQRVDVDSDLGGVANVSTVLARLQGNGGMSLKKPATNARNMPCKQPSFGMPGHISHDQGLRIPGSLGEPLSACEGRKLSTFVTSRKPDSHIEDVPLLSHPGPVLSTTCFP